jgi:hypothetical protein
MSSSAKLGLEDSLALFGRTCRDGKMGNFSMTEVPATPFPAWYRKTLRSKKNLADIEKMPLVGG